MASIRSNPVSESGCRVVGVLLAAIWMNAAAAHDLLPPPFRGLPGSTTQSWDFVAPLPIPAPPDGPCPPQNPAGMPSMVPSPDAVWMANFQGREGVWCLPNGGALHFNHPNPGGAPFEFKTIWVQITMHFHGANPPLVVTAGPLSFVVGTQDLPVPGKGPGWVHRTVSVCFMPPCPPFEVVSLINASTDPADHIDIAQVVIDTMCEIECSTPHPPMAPGDYDGDGIGDNWDNAPGIFNPNQSDCDGDLVGDVSDTCEICPPGTPDKGEPCGTDLNGGCNSPGVPLSPLHCNETICGEAWAEAGTRDTDWYRIDLQDTNGDGSADLILDLCTSLPLIMAVLGPSCPPSAIFGITDAALDRPARLTLCLPAPASYFVFIATGQIGSPISDGYPCNGLYNQYWLSAWCADPCATCGLPGGNDCCSASPAGTPGCKDAECCAKVCEVDPFCCNAGWDGLCAIGARTLCRDICCTADFNGDGVVDGADLGFLLGYWGADYLNPADLDGDCDVDGADLGILLGQWGLC